MLSINDMERKLILYAMPIFAIAIAIEFLVSWLKKDGRYRINDAVGSLSVGLLGTSGGLLTAGSGIYFYSILYQHFVLLKLDSNNLAVLISANIVYDFFYYWFHRFHHRINILWAAHAPHHQSEEFNFTTAGRQGVLIFIFSWIFYLPMALMGFSPETYLFAAAISVIYGFFTHTRYIPNLGPFEKIFIGASNHRVHHGRNPVYIDKNYGSILSIWDRMFGTYQPELASDPVVYGVVHPLNSWNPVWANLDVYAQLLKDSVLATKFKDKFRLWFMETGWRPEDLRPKTPYQPDLSIIYNPKPSLLFSLYALFQFGAGTICTLLLLKIFKGVGLALDPVIYCIELWFGLATSGMILEGKELGLKLEPLRIFLLVITVACKVENPIFREAAFGYAAVSLAWALGLNFRLVPGTQIRSQV